MIFPWMDGFLDLTHESLYEICLLDEIPRKNERIQCIHFTYS